MSAAGLWGTYKGNNIIRLTVDGSPVKVSDVPAMSYQGRTMVPIYLLQQAGVSYTWDQENQTVNVSIQSKIEPEPPFDAAKTAIDIIEQGGGGVTIVKENGATTALVFMEKIKGFEQDWDRMANIFTLLLEYKTSILKMLLRCEE